MTGQVSHGHQKENEQIDPHSWWVKKGRANWADVVAATDAINGPLFGAATNSYHGTNDKIAANVAALLQRSLVLIKPEDLRLDVDDESIFGGGDQRRVRARFNYANIRYGLVVTDPFIEANYRAQLGIHPIPVARMCVSLAEVYNGSATTLAASIITPQRAG